MKARALRSLFPLALAVLFAAGPWLPVRLNLTPSLPRGLYLETGSSPRRGDLAMACLPLSIAAVGLERGYLRPGSCPSGTAPVLKWIAASQGDHVSATREGLSINGRLLRNSRARATDSGGRLLASAPPPVSPLAPAVVWLYTPDSNSWDSRYYGALPAESVVGTVRPLLTFPALVSIEP